MNREGVDREGMNREQQLRRDIEELTAVTAALEAAAGDLLRDESVVPSNTRARQEVIELLGVNYVGPEIFNEIFEPNGLFDRFKLAFRYLFKDRVIPLPFEEPPMDFVKLKEILNEADEWEIGKRKFETYALVFKPPISFLELRDRANEVATAQGRNPAFYIDGAGNWYISQAFATEAPDTGSWELVRRETVPGSTKKEFDDQKALIADQPNISPASLPALASLLVGQYLAHDIKLYNGEWHFGRTSTRTADGGPVHLGRMNVNGAFIRIGSNANDDDGLVVSRKLN